MPNDSALYHHSNASTRRAERVEEERARSNRITQLKACIRHYEHLSETVRGTVPLDASEESVLVYTDAMTLLGERITSCQRKIAELLDAGSV